MNYLTRFLAAAILLGSLSICDHKTCIAQQKRGNATGHTPSYNYDTPGTQLRGILIEREVYGPPGYGETPAKDTRTAIFILKLLPAISVEPVANSDTYRTPNLDPAKNVREIQLFVNQPRLKAIRKLIGRSVVATGTLNESVTASQYTKVWLDVKTLAGK